MAMIPGDLTCTTGLSASIYTTILAQPCGAIDNAQLKALAFAIASCVVQEITTNAVVVPTMVVPPGSSVVTGTGAIT